MASRRDQLHSYQFMIQRVVAALVMRETDPAQSPFRRAAGAIFAGVMIGVIVIAGFAIYGLWKPGGNLAWKEASDGNKGQPVVVVEEETGATYVYMNKTLFPMENITSALLIGNPAGAGGEPFYVSRNSLASDELHIARGPRLGIPGAPDSLPSQDNIVHEEWTLCTQPKYDPSGDTSKLETVLVVGNSKLANEQHLAGESAMLVEEEGTSTKYLIYDSHRFKIDNESVVLEAAGITGITPLKAPKAWTNALPVGQEITPLPIDGAGEASSVRTDAVVGQLFMVEGTGAYYVALRDKLAAVTQFQAALITADTGEEATKISTSDAAGMDKTNELMPENLHQGAKPPPASLPLNMVRPDQTAAACAIFDPYRRGDPKLRFNGTLGIRSNEGVITKSQGEYGDVLASRVVVSLGKGAFVMAGTQLCLVTDTGRYFPLPSKELLERLGYDKSTDVGTLPQELVARLPKGPALDPRDAMLPVT